MNIDPVIADNIMDKLQGSGKDVNALAAALGTDRQTVRKMLDGGQAIDAVALNSIAGFLNTSVGDLVTVCDDGDVIERFMNEVDSESAKEALRIVDELADLIIFHARVRENAEEMLKPFTLGQ